MVWMTLTFIQSHGCMRNKKLQSPFSHKLICWLDEIGCVATTCWFVETRANFFVCTNNIQGKELCWRYILWYVCLASSCIRTLVDQCVSNLFSLLNTAKVYSLISVWMTLMFTQGHWATGKLELVQAFCCKVAWSSSNVGDGWLCKGNGSEEVL